MRIGLFGGSFDPVHYSHLLLAESCREQLSLDRVWFVPAAAAPHKQSGAAPAAQRIEMLKLAIGGHEAFEVCTREIDRGGISYTADTLRELKGEDPTRELFLLLGADMFADLPNWRESGVICTLATPVAVRRTSSPEPNVSSLAATVSPARLVEIAQNRVEMPRIDLSSSDIRRRVSAGRSIRYMVPRAVEKYIETQGLYRQ